MTTCDHGIRLDTYCASCEWTTCANCLRVVSEVDAETGECRECYEGFCGPATSRAGWLIPLILIAVAVAAVAWRLR